MQKKVTKIHFATVRKIPIIKQFFKFINQPVASTKMVPEMPW